jgi:hypothetical protein
MLTNADKLPEIYPNGDRSKDPLSFSIVTDDAVYIKGDYNTGGTGDQVPSNRPTALPGEDSYAPNYTPVPTAIIADAVGVVSKNFQPWAGNAEMWDVFQNTDPLRTSTYLPNINGQPDPRVGEYARGATNTTVNTAIITGNVGSATDGAGESSGGAQNLFRQLENWSDPLTGDQTRVTYNGSLMQMFRSRVLDGTFSNSFFNNPLRDFRYDKKFLNRPPAGATRIYSYSRGKWIRS